MKTTCLETVPKKSGFPKLMRGHSANIYLITRVQPPSVGGGNKLEGFALHITTSGVSDMRVGDAVRIPDDELMDFHGTLTLENE